MSQQDSDDFMLTLARRHETPRSSYGQGLRFALRRIEYPTNGMKIRFVLAVTVVVGCLMASGWQLALQAAGVAFCLHVLGYLYEAAWSRSKIDEETLQMLANDATSITRQGLLSADYYSDEKTLNDQLIAILNDLRPNRAAIRRRAATSMVAIRCLHARTMREVDDSHHRRALEEAVSALKQIRAETLAAIVPVQDEATGLLSRQVQAIAAPKPAHPTPIPTMTEERPTTGHPEFDRLVLRVRDRIAHGDDPVDAGGSPVAPLVEKHLPALMAAHARAIGEGGDTTAAHALLDRSIGAMTRSFEEALSRPLPSVQSAMDDLETRTRFLESRSVRI